MKKIEEYLYNNGLDWTDIILYILMGVLIALAVVLINQVKPDKKYLAKIDIVTYKDETTEYDVMEIISKVKEK